MGTLAHLALDRRKLTMQAREFWQGRLHWVYMLFRDVQLYSLLLKFPGDI
jgi:hypothetical protein